MEEAYRYKWESTIGETAAIRLIRYSTPEDLLVSMWQCPIEEIKESTHGGVDADGNEYELSYEEYLKTINDIGCYAFTRGKEEIHVWVDFSQVCVVDFVGMMAHEKGHLTRPFHRDEIEEEMKAERYGDAAAFAYQVYSELK